MAQCPTAVVSDPVCLEYKAEHLIISSSMTPHKPSKDHSKTADYEFGMWQPKNLCMQFFLVEENLPI